MKVLPLISYSSMKKKFGMIRMVFDIENWHWKSEFRDLQGQISNRAFLQWETAIYHSINLGFEGQVAKKFLNGIYCPGPYGI